MKHTGKVMPFAMALFLMTAIVPQASAQKPAPAATPAQQQTQSRQIGGIAKNRQGTGSSNRQATGNTGRQTGGKAKGKITSVR